MVIKMADAWRIFSSPGGDILIMYDILFIRPLIYHHHTGNSCYTRTIKFFDFLGFFSNFWGGIANNYGVFE
jgi:hypothetical protein